jgi:murein DD-endopeptidase MepM/ murein hydrolase activator NlpD
MSVSSDILGATGICETCGTYLVSSRYVQPRGRAVLAFCSETCLGDAVRAQREQARAARIRYARRLTIGVVFAGACLTPHQWPAGPRQAKVAPAPPPAAKPSRMVPPPGWFGPEWPPTETSLLAALGRDAWVHPLAGPVRRMPRSDTRVFGAGRPGKRPWECRNGHCGVDLGGEIWGEHVRAAHDGVIDFVQRGANPDRGGRFVRIAHHEGTVFTQYFHLAAIPRGLERGVAVKSGQVVGLLGDSGVKESKPHLHFAVSIKRSSEDHFEKYIDPEPLIALWPLHVPLEGTETGLVTITGLPGVPLGTLPLMASHARTHAKGKRGAATADGDGTPAPAPEEEEESTGEAATPESAGGE